MCVCRPQPGGDRGQNHVHLRSAGDGRRLREAGRWRSAGSGQTGETHFCQCLDQLQQKLHPQQIPKIRTNLSHHVLQALINIGEILKAAGCDYSNGEKLSFSSYVSHVLKFKHELSEHINPFISVVKTTVLLADINDFNNVNEVYKTCKPALYCSFHFDHTSRENDSVTSLGVT